MKEQKILMYDVSDQEFKELTAKYKAQGFKPGPEIYDASGKPTGVIVEREIPDQDYFSSSTAFSESDLNSSDEYAEEIEADQQPEVSRRVPIGRIIFLAIIPLALFAVTFYLLYWKRMMDYNYYDYSLNPLQNIFAYLFRYQPETIVHAVFIMLMYYGIALSFTSKEFWGYIFILLSALCYPVVLYILGHWVIGTLALLGGLFIAFMLIALLSKIENLVLRRK